MGISVKYFVVRAWLGRVTTHVTISDTRTRFTEPYMSEWHQCEASTCRHEAHFATVVRGLCSCCRCRFRRPWSCRCRHGCLTVLVLAAAAVVVLRL